MESLLGLRMSNGLQAARTALRRLMACVALALALLHGVQARAQLTDAVQDLANDRDSIQVRLDLLADPQTRQVDITTYLFSADRVGLVLIAALLEAAERGVKIRLLADLRFHQTQPALLGILQQAGVEIRIHNPPSHFLREAWKAPLQAFAMGNRRMHDKIFTVNADKAIVGDKNYSEKFFRFSLRQGDTMTGKEIYVQGRAVREIQEHFDRLWNHPASHPVGRPPSQERTKGVRARLRAELQPYRDWARARIKEAAGSWRRPLLPYDESRFLVNAEQSALAQTLDAIATAPAGSRILIENSYFVLFPEMETALKKALARGCRIHVALNRPDVADQKIIGEALQQDLPRMIEMGLEVSLYHAKRRTTHAKLVLIGDQTVIIGTTNFDPRSYRLNSESNLALNSAALNARYWERFQADADFRTKVYPARSCSAVFAPRSFEMSERGLFSRTLINWIRPQL